MMHMLEARSRGCALQMGRRLVARHSDLSATQWIVMAHFGPKHTTAYTCINIR